MRLIQSLASKELVRNLPKLKFDQHFCDAFKMGKQAHASHKAKNIVSTTRCLELLHMDLFSPSTVWSYGGYSQNSKAYIILNKHTKKVKESLNVTFDETPLPSKTPPLVDDDLDEDEAIRETKKKNLEKDVEDETLEIDEIFEMSMMGELNFFLGLQIKQMEDGIFFNESKYIKEMLKKFGLKDSKPMKTPMSSDTKLTKDEELIPQIAFAAICQNGGVTDWYQRHGYREQVMFSSPNYTIVHSDSGINDAIPPPQVIIALSAILPPSPLLSLSPMFDSQDSFPSEKISSPEDIKTPISSSSSVGSSSTVRSTTSPPDYLFNECIFAELDNSLWIISRPLGSEPDPKKPNTC
ncbi:copia protein [Tanacetum coccineum]